MSKDSQSDQKKVEFNSIGDYISSLKNGSEKSLPAVNIYDQMSTLFPKEMQGVENPINRVTELKKKQEQQTSGQSQKDTAPDQEQATNEKEPQKKKRNLLQRLYEGGKKGLQRLVGYRSEPKERESRMTVEGTHQRSEHHRKSKRHGQWWSRNYKTESTEKNHYDLHPLTKTSFTETVEATKESNLWGFFSREKRKYSGGGIDQETSTIKLLWGLVEYENDWHPLGITDKQGFGDGGDRYRTARLVLGPKGIFQFGFRLGTGDPGMIPEGMEEKDYRNIDTSRGRKGYYMPNEHGDDPDKYRMGQAFIELGGHRVGLDSEKIRALIQHSIHWIIGDEYFNVLDDKVEGFYEKRKNH